jgi:hypothetical protein
MIGYSAAVAASNESNGSFFSTGLSVSLRDPEILAQLQAVYARFASIF